MSGFNEVIQSAELAPALKRANEYNEYILGGGDWKA